MLRLHCLATRANGVRGLLVLSLALAASLSAHAQADNSAMNSPNLAGSHPLSDTTLLAGPGFAHFQNITWSADFSSETAGMNYNWQWSADSAPDPANLDYNRHWSEALQTIFSSQLNTLGVRLPDNSDSGPFGVMVGTTPLVPAAPSDGGTITGNQDVAPEGSAMAMILAGGIPLMLLSAPRVRRRFAARKR